jgi:hypothetical protein
VPFASSNLLILLESLGSNPLSEVMSTEKGEPCDEGISIQRQTGLLPADASRQAKYAISEHHRNLLCLA